jgi:tetratricopeptide (TPR) repeat protein
MKRVCLILLMFMLFGVVSASPDSLFQEANLLYQKGSYELALEQYTQVLDSGLESADLYYNMGNAAYRSNSIGYAILYFEKALKLNPSHEDASNNLEFTSRYRVDTFEEVPELFIRTWMRVLLLKFSERSWSLVSLFLFILLTLAALIYIFSRRLLLKKIGFFTSLIGFLLFILTFSAAIARHKSIIHPDAAIILAPSVVVRSSPSDTGTELFILHEGTKVKVNEGVSGWQNIRVIDGREGWISSGDFESI